MALSLITIAENVFGALAQDYAGMPECDDGLSAQWQTTLHELDKSNNLYDRQLYRFMTRRLASLGDRNLQFLPGPNASFQPVACGFDVRRSGDALYVTRVREDMRMHAGDAITALGTMPLDAYLEQAIGNPVGDSDPERQLWGSLLAEVSRVQVRHADGSVKSVKLRTYPVAARKQDPCAFEDLGGGVCLMRVTQFDDDEAGRTLAAHADEAKRAARLIIDVRTCSGGAEANAYPLLDYVFDEATNLSEVQAPEVVLTNYSEANCARREQQINQLRMLAQAQPDENQERLLSWMDENLEVVHANRGKGYVEETVRPDDLAIAAAPAGQKLIILTDVTSADAAEWFVRLARQSERVTVVGRATQGNLDYSNPLAMAFEDRFVFVYPMSKSKSAAQGDGMRGRGIAPDVTVGFTPDECMQDVILQRALDLEL
jgi:C-terminal processing protease CtpA/Prc